MTKEKDSKIGMGCIIGGLIAGAAVAVFGVILVGVLALLAAPTLLNAADKAKEGAVKANVSAAASTAVTYLMVEEYTPDKTAAMSIKALNEVGTPDDPADDAKSPFDSTLPAYSDKPAPGVVTIKPSGNDVVEITGYDKNEQVLVQKVITSAGDIK